LGQIGKDETEPVSEPLNQGSRPSSQPVPGAQKLAAAIPQMLANALVEHRAGRFEEAKRLYLQILSIDVRHADSLHLLGLVEYEGKRYEPAYHCNLGLVLEAQGRLGDAVGAYRQAIAFRNTSVEAHYNLGNALRRLGRPAEAVPCYERAIELQPNHASALNNLGNTLWDLGQGAGAVACYQRALAIHPDNPEALNNLGNILQDQGKPADAKACFERALILNPNYADAWSNLGAIFRDFDDFEKARACFMKALELKPNHPNAFCNLGAVLLDLGQFEEATACLERALELNPDYCEAVRNMGTAFQEQDKPDDAAACYRRVLELDPGNTKALNNLGTVLLEQGRLEEAKDCFERALAIYPPDSQADPKQNSQPLTNLGTVLAQQGKLEESRDCQERALALKPENAEACNNLGTALLDEGRIEEAEALLARSMALKSRNPEAQMNQSLVQLLQGNYAEGWRNYEGRFARKKGAPRRFPQPTWRGRPLNGQRILLHAEQGLGDSLQFLRYIPLVKAAGGYVILDIQGSLRRLAEQLPGVDELVSTGDPLPPFDWQCPLMSLPLAFGTRVETIPATVPYLRVPAAAVEKAAGFAWDADLHRARLRVGLCWAGNPTHAKDRFRSMRLAALEPLMSIEGVHFYSLQMGKDAEQLAAFQTGPDSAIAQITDLGPAIGDMADTAALLAHLDLVITVDTSVAHVAGALARPLWLLLPHTPDWRWLLQREDSPWYPTMRLFRQANTGDWSGVVERVREELAKLASQVR
jgi:tetratricopeptide (TPR) repeat protein